MPDIINQVVVDSLLEHQLDLMRLEAGVRARVVRLLNQLQAELAKRITGDKLSDWSKARLQTLLRQANETIEDYYTRIREGMAATLTEVAEIQSRYVATLVVSTNAALPTETYLARLVSNMLVHGAPSADWWGRQALDVQFRFATAVRQGAAAGETNEQIVARVAGSPRKGIPGIMNVTRLNARALIHSSLQTVANAGRMETFRKNSDVVKGVRQVSTFDSHTTEICMAYHGKEWDLDGKPINGTKLPFVSPQGSQDGVPRHWNCRSVLVPITKSYRDLGIDIDELPPVRSTTMEQWLSRRTVEQQDEQLGPGRAQMWRDGDLTLEQLLTLSGNTLTLAQLRARYA